MCLGVYVYVTGLGKNDKTLGAVDSEYYCSFKFVLIYFYVYGLFVVVCLHVCLVPVEARIPWDWSRGQVSASICILGIELRPSAKVAHANSIPITFLYI